jgi:hypothetical protein
MDLEQDYLEYVIQFSVALFAVSAAYFIDLSNLLTLTVLILIPILFGYTAYISREKFKYSSFLAFISLIFVPLNPIMAVVAIIISIGNVMVSFFAGGTQFKDYYRATMLPLLFTGLILGGATYAATTYQPSFGDELRTGIADTIGSQTSTILDETNLVEMQQDANRRVVEEVSTGTVMATRGYIINESQENLSLEGQQAVLQAFSSAQEEVPEMMLKASEQSQNQTQVLNISDRVSGSIENLISGKKILVIVPIITFGMYGLQPVIGLLTAIFATLTQKLGRSKEDQ